MRGFGRRGRGGGRGSIPTKEDLDAQLDAYNAKVLSSVILIIIIVILILILLMSVPA